MRNFYKILLLFLNISFSLIGTVKAQSDTEETTIHNLKRGKNSYTYNQIETLLKTYNYENIKILRLDNHGIWHIIASKNKERFIIFINYQGCVKPITLEAFIKTRT